MQHIALDCKNVPMDERKREMRERGFETVMEGCVKGGTRYVLSLLS